MPYTLTLMDDQQVSVPLHPDTPQSVLRAVGRDYYHSAIVITPLWLRPGDISDANILAQACFTGIYTGQSDNLLNLNGAGLEWLLGGDGDDGDSITGADGTTGSATIAAHLTTYVINRDNGLTAGTITSFATNRVFKTESGTTPRQFLDTFCAAYNTSAFEWRINPAGTIDVNAPATLWPTNTTPTVVLTQDGGRDGAVTGIRADLDLSTIDVDDYRTHVVVDWDSGTNDGAATNTPPTGWKNFAGGSLIRRTVLDHRPKKPFREKPNRNLRQNANAYAIYSVNSQTQANNVAARHAAAVNSYALELDADIDEFHPTRFLTPGDAVWVYDIDLDLIDTANEIYYRGSAIHPVKLRVQRMTCPIQEGMGVYLRRWTGAAFELYDLTPYVDFEVDTTTVELGTRRQFSPHKPRARKINRKQTKKDARAIYKLRQFFARR
jgi:hypothetical protein